MKQKNLKKLKENERGVSLLFKLRSASRPTIPLLIYSLGLRTSSEFLEGHRLVLGAQESGIFLRILEEPSLANVRSTSRLALTLL